MSRARVAALALLLGLWAGPGLAESIEITAPGPEGALAGTLEAPDTGTRAAALILPGSGPTDRDGNNPLGVVTDSYRLLAEALAARGIATARIDKRGLAGSRAAGDPNAVSLAAYRDDVAAWRDVILAETGQECLWLVGHSEGALVSLVAHDLGGICGLVLLSVSGRPLGPLILDQLAAQGAGDLVPEAAGAIDALLAGDDVDHMALPPQIRGLFRPEVQAFVTDLLSTDPAVLIARTAGPVLLIHGDADIQVAPGEAGPLVAARPDITALVLPGLTHTLKAAVPGDPVSSLPTYTDASLPLHPGLVPAIADFVLGQR